jgi:hypothetical protein
LTPSIGSFGVLLFFRRITTPMLCHSPVLEAKMAVSYVLVTYSPGGVRLSVDFENGTDIK